MMETIEDIVSKMLEAAKKSPFVNSLDLVFFATHITAAYHESAKYQTKLLEEYRAENDRLKTALKPVLRCSVIDIKSEMVDAFFAVRKAQEIYNEGANNENR